MSFTLLSVPIILIFLIVACIEMDAGAKRGFHLSMISLGTVIFSVFLSFPLTAMLMALVASRAVSLLRGVEAYAQFAALLPSLDALVSDLGAMLLGPFLFVFVFFAVRLAVGGVVSSVYKKCTGNPKVAFRSRADRRRGAACGLACAWILTLVLTSPLMGTLGLAKSGLHIVNQASTEAYEAIGEENAAAVRRYSDDIAGNLFYQLGGKAVYSSAATVVASGRRIYLLSELEVLETMSVDMLDVYQVFDDPHEAEEAHVQALRRLKGDVEKLVLCEDVAADIIRGCALSWLNGQTFLTVEAPVMTQELTPLFRGVLEVCSHTNAMNVKQNAATLLDVYALLLESGVFRIDPAQTAEVLAALDAHGTVGKVESALAENPAMRRIDVSCVITARVGGFVCGEALAAEARTRLAEALAGAVDLARENGGGAEALAPSLQAAFAEAGLALPDGLSVWLSEKMLSDLPEREMSPEAVLTLFERYRSKIK